MQNTDLELISTALQAAGITGFIGTFTALGGGEVNNTYRLDFSDKQLILRIAKDEEQQTLRNEARSLRLLDLKNIPKLIYFDENSKINNRLWILESYLAGVTVDRLSIEQFNSLGSLLAETHRQESNEAMVDLRQQFIESCKSSGDEQYLLNHPDTRLRELIRAALDDFSSLQSTYDKVTPTLIHSDATPSNILVDGNEASLIDWEFSIYSDPMRDFSTIYYEDIEYNQGKWRIKITDVEKQSLFDGYRSKGGIIDEERIKFWIRFDKLVAAVFLFWRVNESVRATGQPEMDQYKFDFENLVKSLGG